MKSSQKLVIYQNNMFNRAIENAIVHTQEFKTYVRQTATIINELAGRET
ncbi:MAG: hypothetical protein NC489_32375 [Ruminococcus flavefaciens]|nr:hypothetical protein [Ruminococcus flavefaciens]